MSHQKTKLTTSMITHLVIVPADSAKIATTFFQGFSFFWSEDYIDIFHALTFFPHDIADPFLSIEDSVVTKAFGGGSRILFLRVDLLQSYLQTTGENNIIIWSSSLVVDDVNKALDSIDHSAIHISAAYRENIPCIKSLNKEKSKDLIIEIISSKASTDTEMREFKSWLESRENAVKEHTSSPFIEAKGHNCTTPMINVLLSCNYNLNITPIEPSESIDEHISGMLNLAKVIDLLRKEELKASPLRNNDAIIHCPSFYTFLYRADGNMWNKIIRNLSNAKRNFLKHGIIRNKGYGNSTFHLDPEDIFNPYEDNTLGTLLLNRQLELKIFTSVIGLLATRQCIPAFRFPNAVMLHHSKLRAIAQLINTNNKKRNEKLNLTFLEYGNTIKEIIGEDLLHAALSERKKILAVCDFPIEWVAIDQLPLMFKSEISRTPSTPGNVVISTLLSSTKTIYSYSDLCNILVLRSFKDTDPIKEHLVSSINERVKSNKFSNIHLTIVDIDSKADLIKALNEFKGLMVIFDCHGCHGGENEPAWLIVGGERLDIWHIYQHARVPPIIVLAACSTHPMEGSHASVANGFLESGAQSVIGTFAPVDSVHAAIFSIRLLDRVDVYLPIVLKNRMYTWREVITGLLRMSYVRDVLESLRDEQKLISEEMYKKLHLDANISINSNEDGNWYEAFRNSICDTLKLDQKQTKDMWEKNFQFVQTMLFVQIGRPENIVISLRPLN